MKPGLRIDLDAVRRNVGLWREHSGRPVWAVVKCDAYRLGAASIGRAALAGGAERLCVIDIAEAEALRADGITAPIVQICATPRGDLERALEAGVVASVQDVADAAALSRLALSRGRPVHVHVAIDSGSGWSGVPASSAAAFGRAAAALPGLIWEAAWTHIAGRPSLDSQRETFERAVQTLRQQGLALPLVHFASTGPSLWAHAQGASRIGIGLYGSTMGEPHASLPLRTALELRAPVYMVRRFTESTPLGYGGSYVAQAGEAIVTLRIGYGEGVPRSLSGRGSALVGATSCPIVGTIGMNFTMLAWPAEIKPPEVGDEALLLADKTGLRLDEVARAADMIPHNVVTLVGSSLQPEYVGLAAQPDRPIVQSIVNQAL